MHVRTYICCQCISAPLRSTRVSTYTKYTYVRRVMFTTAPSSTTPIAYSYWPKGGREDEMYVRIRILLVRHAPARGAGAGTGPGPCSVAGGKAVEGRRRGGGWGPARRLGRGPGRGRARESA